MSSCIQFRMATDKDTATVMRFIRELAEHQRLSHALMATEDSIRKWVFEERLADVVIACDNGEDVGFALYYRNFSTILGRVGIHLEDLYVRPEYRGRGYGKALLGFLASLTVKEGCGRLEWICLDWNRPSVEFYLGIGATPLNEWTTYRLDGEALERAAHMNDG